MKKLSVMVSGLVLGLVIAGGAMTAVQAAQVPATAKSNVDITQRFDEMSFLTSLEKQQLKEAQKKSAPHYEQISKLEKELIKISDSIMKDAESIIEESNNIYFKNMNLWNKVYSDVAAVETFKEFPSHTEQLQSAKSLTAKEKELLKKDAKRMDEIEEKMQEFYERVRVATKDIDAKIDEEYEKIYKIDSVNQKIWDKIAENMDAR